MKAVETFSASKTFVLLTFVVVISFVTLRPDVNTVSLSDMATQATADFTQTVSSEETKTIEVYPRVVIIQKGQSLIEVTGMNETQAHEFAKDNGMDFDKNNNPVVHEGNKLMLFPGSINPTDSVWFADGYHNRKTN